MSRVLPFLVAGLCLFLACASMAAAAQPPDVEHPPPESGWHTSYREAMDAAKRDGKMLLIYFHEPDGSASCEQFSRETLSAPVVVEKLRGFVALRLPLGAAIRAGGEELTLLEHFSFAEMLGTAGVAILDFAHKGADHYGHVVGVFPFLDGQPYRADQLAVILDLPPGTMTQRALVYAVRTHTDRPASAEGELDPYLLKQATRHSQHQARIRRQGHHNWQHRFRRITAELPNGLV
ncbi:MAG: thioredoxin family protein, partial [Planctomycetes bacterium]|nr:thioredoxin family protein [Planctomycetota bacterium]